MHSNAGLSAAPEAYSLSLSLYKYVDDSATIVLAWTELQFVRLIAASLIYGERMSDINARSGYTRNINK